MTSAYCTSCSIDTRLWISVRPRRSRSPSRNTPARRSVTPPRWSMRSASAYNWSTPVIAFRLARRQRLRPTSRRRSACGRWPSGRTGCAPTAPTGGCAAPSTSALGPAAHLLESDGGAAEPVALADESGEGEGLAGPSVAGDAVEGRRAEHGRLLDEYPLRGIRPHVGDRIIHGDGRAGHPQSGRGNREKLIAARDRNRADGDELRVQPGRGDWKHPRNAMRAKMTDNRRGIPDISSLRQNIPVSFFETSLDHSCETFSQHYSEWIVRWLLCATAYIRRATGRAIM